LVGENFDVLWVYLINVRGSEVFPKEGFGALPGGKSKRGKCGIITSRWYYPLKVDCVKKADLVK
jgi:hypothetical protein